MFDAYKALTPLDGKSYENLRELLRALGRVRWDHLTELSVDYGVDELMDLLRARNWLVEEDSGTLRIQLGSRRKQSTNSALRDASKKTRPKLGAKRVRHTVTNS